jgi:methionyl-tRNA formyltransferase
MRIVFMGTPPFAVPSLRSLVQAGHPVALVVTRPDKPRRTRSSPPEPSAVKQAALELGIGVLQPDTARDPELSALLREAAPDAIVVVAFGQVLPAAILEIPPKWCINLHASLLPAYRGAAPIARSILAGDVRTGATTMRMDRGLDTGDLLLSRAIVIEADETAGELTARLADLGAGLLVETLARHETGSLTPVPQDSGRATLAPAIRRADGVLRWEEPATTLACRVRGCHPWPLATAGLRGAPIQVLRAGVDASPHEPGGPPGQILEVSQGRIVVTCGSGSFLEILELRFPGRRAMSARDALNGRLVSPGDCFTPPSA